jgi:hypothetical protein
MSLPAQFRIFRKGANPSTKGTVYFDDIAAREVMANYQQHGARIMLDLEHLSLNKQSPNYNPNAMGWFSLALKAGELWAVQVKGTDEGNERVDSKKQAYTSPFFAVDPKTKRVKCIINVALTALPATDKPMALVAANQVSGLMAFSTIGNNMDLSALLELLGLPPEATLDDIVAAVKALQGGGAKPAAGDATPTSEALAEPDMGGATAPMANQSTSPKKTTVSIQHSQDTSGPAIIALTREVAALKADKLKDKRDALIVANASKLTPVLEAWARTQSIETLTAYFSAATPLEGVDTEAVREINTNTETETIALSQAEIDICNMTGTSLEAALAYKKGNK